MSDSTSSLVLFFLIAYSLVNYIDSEPITNLLALSAVNVRKKIDGSKLETCNTVDLNQLTSMTVESDGNVIIKLPEDQKLILSKDFIEWFRGEIFSQTLKVHSNLNLIVLIVLTEITV